MSDDPYALLGVARDASQEAIRKAYRSLAKDLHPDLNPGDSAAEERFKAVSAAYHLLGDPERRARFDRGEIDASGAERPEAAAWRRHAEADRSGRYAGSAGHGDFEDMSDLFADLFGTRAGARGAGLRMRGPDRRFHLELELPEAVAGTSRRITLPEGGTLDLVVPPGTRAGTVLRLRGKGGPGLGGGPPGDALVEIGLRPHPRFRVEGDDVLTELPVSIDEAVLGARVEVPTLTGRVTLRVPEGTSGGTVLRLRGKGLPRADGGAGDQKVTIRIVLPRTIDPDLKTFLEGWRKTHAYDARAGQEGS
ncbi:MAG: J domain-containing protein [Alphaproteobacteria bacterium]|nr:J domain-containing protein [Alphaproteobacteria bacterium]